MGRQYKKDTLQFLFIARGSAYEVETLLNIGQMINLLDKMVFDQLIVQVSQTIKLLNGLINYWEKAALK